MTTLKYGKYSGTHISEVPEDYLDWMRRDGVEKIAMVDEELLRRKAHLHSSFMMKLIDHGYNALLATTSTPEDKAKALKARQILENAVTQASKAQSP